MTIDFELAADAIKPPTVRETAVAIVGLAGYCAALFAAGTLALAVWGAQSAWRSVRR